MRVHLYAKRSVSSVDVLLYSNSHYLLWGMNVISTHIPSPKSVFICISSSAQHLLVYLLWVYRSISNYSLQYFLIESPRIQKCFQDAAPGRFGERIRHIDASSYPTDFVNLVNIAHLLWQRQNQKKSANELVSIPNRILQPALTYSSWRSVHLLSRPWPSRL